MDTKTNYKKCAQRNEHCAYPPPHIHHCKKSEKNNVFDNTKPHGLTMKNDVHFFRKNLFKFFHFNGIDRFKDAVFLRRA